MKSKKRGVFLEFMGIKHEILLGGNFFSGERENCSPRACNAVALGWRGVFAANDIATASTARKEAPRRNAGRLGCGGGSPVYG
jgi:hypothetical protein